MTSLREGLRKSGFYKSEPLISVKRVAQIFALKATVSVRRVIQLLEPKENVFETGWIGSDANKDIHDGIAKANIKLVLKSTGFWSLKGEFANNGHPDATCIFAIRPITEGWAKVFMEKAELDGNGERTFQTDGRDLWICGNWTMIQKNGFSWSFRASESVNAPALIGLVLMGVLGAVLGGTYVKAEADGKCYTDPSGDRICPLD
jgi:hypothetical protein